jgi:hypothetical protein
MTLTKAQVRFLKQLASDPEPNIFAWKSKRNGRIVEAFGGPDNWTVFQIQTVTKATYGKKVVTSSLSKDEHFDLIDRGFTAACRITDAGRAALTPPIPEGNGRMSKPADIPQDVRDAAYEAFSDAVRDEAKGPEIVARAIMAATLPMLEALQEARLQASILQERLGIKDTGAGTLSIIDAALAKATPRSGS